MMRAAQILSATLVLVVGACGDDGPAPDEETWQLLGEGRPSALLAAWASSVDDAWVVGGREGAGGSPSVFHFDGSAWTKLDTGRPNFDVWQVFGFANGDVFLGGSNGTILRYRSGTFEVIPTPGTSTVFGLWGTGPDDVWAVGGQSAGGAFVWRYRGGAGFEVVPGVPAELVNGGAVWKVTGRSPDDVWMSCSRSTVLHWDGQTLASESIGPTGDALFSIGCSSERCTTAGGFTEGVLYENSGSGWSSNAPAGGPVWRGVTPTGDHQFVVGMGGAVIRRTETSWVTEPHGLTQRAFHAVWGTDDGSLFAVGGDFDRPITLQGVLLFRGTEVLPPLP